MTSEKKHLYRYRALRELIWAMTCWVGTMISSNKIVILACAVFGVFSFLMYLYHDYYLEADQ